MINDVFLIFSTLWALIIFGNIENLILSSQGVVAGVNARKLGLLSIICVLFWLILGTSLTQLAIDYAAYIEFIGGLTIFILGIQSMWDPVKEFLAKRKGN